MLFYQLNCLAWKFEGVKNYIRIPCGVNYPSIQATVAQMNVGMAIGINATHQEQKRADKLYSFKQIRFVCFKFVL